MATASDLQQLYIGYFGRAADQEGLNFWLGAINNDGLSLDNVHAAFVNSAEYNAQYEGLTLTQKVAAVYQNVLGRAADTEGAAFWTKAIEDGTITEDQLIEALLSGLSTKDAQAISNKIVVANYYTSAKGDAYVEASKAESGAIIKAVTDKLDTVGTALTKVGEVVGVSNAELATALNALQAAEKAQVEVAKAFLGDAAKGLSDTAVLAAADAAGTGIAAKADTALGAVQTAANNVQAGVTLDAASAAAKIKIAQDKAAADVSASRAEVAKVAGLPDLVTKFNAQAKVWADATAALPAAAAQQAGELVTFNGIKGGTAATVDATTGVVKVPGATPAEDVEVISLVGGQLVINSAFATANAANEAILKAANDLLADVKANQAAVKASTDAKTALDATGAQIEAASVADTYNDVTGKIVGGVVAAAQADLDQQAALTKAVEAYNKAAVVAADYEAAGAAVESASKAIFDSATGLGFTEVNLTTGNAAATTNKDVFIFDADVTGNGSLTITKGDVLYVGSNYKLGAAEAYTDGKIAGGDNNALEIFFIQKTATTVDIVIEKSAFGTSAATPEVAAISLTGTVDKVSFDAQTGLVTFADVA